MRGGRGRRAAATALALAALAGTAEAAPRPDRAFDLNGSYQRSAGDGGALTSHTGGGSPNAFEGATVPGATTSPRPVLRNEAGNAVQLDSGAPARAAWATSIVFSPSVVTGARRLLGLSLTPSDPGLYIANGVLEWRGTARATRDRTTLIAADTWHHVVLTRTAAGAVEVYLDGSRELRFTDSDGQASFNGVVRLFGDDTTEHGAGRLARLRTWPAALSAADAATLAAHDTTPPVVALREPFEGSVASLRPSFMGEELSDDGTDQPQVAVTVRDESGAQVAAAPGAMTSSVPPRWMALWPQGAAALGEGGWYVAEVRAYDAVGNVATLTRRFLADASPPALEITEGPAETTDATPAIAGTAGTALGDVPFVAVAAHRAGAAGSFDAVGSSDAVLPVTGGRFAGDLTTPLPPGDYVIRVSQVDRANHRAERTRQIRILPEPPAPTTTEQRAASKAATRSVARLRTAALAKLRSARLRRLLAGGERVAFRSDDAGTAVLSVLALPTGRARAAAPKVAFAGRATVRRAGRVTLALRPTRSGRAALRRARAARLVVRAVFTPRSGRAVTRTARLTVRR